MTKTDDDVKEAVKECMKELKIPWLWRWALRALFLALAVSALALAAKLVLWCFV